jgi:hypothetical protein
VLAVTTSLATRWEPLSQALLATQVPEWRRKVVDGRRNWTPVGFLEHVLAEDVDFVVHVDEDCFVAERRGLVDLLDYMAADPRLVAAGVPDGGYYYREHNAAALNLFFVVFRMDALRAAWSKRSRWGTLRFQPEFKREVCAQRPDLDPKRISWDEAEPYYPLFWSLLADGGRFLYLKQELLPSRWSSLVRGLRDENLAEHMWYLRQWFSDNVMPGHDCPNRQRYEAVRSVVMARHAGSFRFRREYLRAQVIRLARRLR